MPRERPKLRIAHLGEPIDELPIAKMLRMTTEGRLFDDGHNIWRVVPFSSLSERVVVLLPRDVSDSLLAMPKSRALEKLRNYVEERYAELKAAGISFKATVIYTRAHVSGIFDDTNDPGARELRKRWKNCLLIVAPKVKPAVFKDLSSPEKRTYIEKSILLYEKLLAYYLGQKTKRKPLLWDVSAFDQYAYVRDAQGNYEFVLMDVEPNTDVVNGEGYQFLENAIDSLGHLHGNEAGGYPELQNELDTLRSKYRYEL